MRRPEVPESEQGGFGYVDLDGDGEPDTVPVDGDFADDVAACGNTPGRRPQS